ncbi:MAG: permease-like cell division protein FtsX [Bdellovibrionales bacterium]|nr:permease-like cell division protein FtsX [Bdellovibrionales bacterium]
MIFWFNQYILRTWKEHTSLQLMTLVVLSATFTIFSGFLFIRSNLSSLLTQWGDQVQITIFLKDEIKKDELSAIKSVLLETPTLTKTKYVSKVEATQNFIKQMGHYSSQLLTDPEFANPLPASLEAQVTQYSELPRLVSQLIPLPGVEDVSYGQGWIENYTSFTQLFSQISLGLILLLLGGGLLIIGNVIQHSIIQRREEIEVLELVGATRLFIQLPFIINGALLGFLGAVFGVLILSGLYLWQQSTMGTTLIFGGAGIKLQFLSLLEIVTLLALGLWFGAFGSFLCIRKFNHGWSASEAHS